MNPLQRVARNPTVYRWLLVNGRGPTDALESFVGFVSGGRFGVLDLVGLPNVRMTVPGRKTGLARTATVQYVPFGEQLLVVGSNWGRSGHPSWSANLTAAQRVTLRERGHRSVATVRLLTGQEREDAWATIVARWPNYQRTQDAAPGRPFRVFLLTPTG